MDRQPTQNIPYSEHRLIRALWRQPVDRTPLWIMRQAGRYLPEYRALRQRAKDFLVLCKTPALACEITLQPVQRFDLDAAIIFSDILVVPEALGMKLSFVEGEGPLFQDPLQNSQAIQKLPPIDVSSELSYVMEAIRLSKQALGGRLPLIGFAGSPWTLATYMIEGKSSKDFSKIKRWLYQDPQSLHALLNHLSHTLIDYLQAQVQAGVDVLMIFDTWGGVLPYQAYLDFSLHYMQVIVSALKKMMALQGPPALKKVPIILFSKNTALHLIAQAATGCDGLGLDWTASLSVARQCVGHEVALQGNMDPAALYADPLQIQQAVKKVLDDFGSGYGHVFNLGHGITPLVDPEHVQAMIEAVHRYGVQDPQKEG
jgi:uroporphyrinogen decarboxylase